MRTKDEILRSALRLPPEERGDVARVLLESLEAPPGILREGTPEFREVILRRVEEIRSGKVETIPADRVLRDIRRRLAKARKVRGKR